MFEIVSWGIFVEGGGRDVDGRERERERERGEREKSIQQDRDQMLLFHGSILSET